MQCLSNVNDLVSYDHSSSVHIRKTKGPEKSDQKAKKSWWPEFFNCLDFLESNHENLQISMWYPLYQLATI